MLSLLSNDLFDQFLFAIFSNFISIREYTMGSEERGKMEDEFLEESQKRGHLQNS
jgi:hypothetical protein